MLCHQTHKSQLSVNDHECSGRNSIDVNKIADKFEVPQSKMMITLLHNIQNNYITQNGMKCVIEYGYKGNYVV